MVKNSKDEKSQKILEGVKELSGGKIIDIEDLNRILDLAVENDRIDLLEDISFEAKYLSGLLKIIKRSDDKIEKDYLDKVTGEYTDGITKFRSLLEQLFSYGNDFIKNIFEKKYLSLTQESLNNLNNLCTDLAWVKNYFNDIKRR